MQNTKIINNLKLKNLKQEYLIKKNEIKKRLKDFDDYYNNSVSWFYNDKLMVLKNVNKNDDQRMFEELCFCILTANTSAEMGMNAIDAIRHLLIDGSQKEMTKNLNGVYRFNNLRPSYIIHTREYLKNEFNFKLKNQIESLKKDKENLRDFFAFNKGIKGLGYKEGSHFLRNIGYKGYAILDKHILNSLFEFGVIDEPKRPSTREKYREIEQKMKKFSVEIGIPMDELDLLFWSRKNGKILK